MIGRTLLAGSRRSEDNDRRADPPSVKRFLGLVVFQHEPDAAHGIAQQIILIECGETISRRGHLPRIRPPAAGERGYIGLSDCAFCMQAFGEGGAFCRFCCLAGHNRLFLHLRYLALTGKGSDRTDEENQFEARTYVCERAGPAVPVAA